MSIPIYRGHWLLGSAPELNKDIMGFMSAKTQELGDTFVAKLPIHDAIITSNPALIKQVLQTKQKQYKKTRMYEEMKLLLGQGLVTSAGDLWRKQRRLAQPAFYKRQLGELFKAMNAAVQKYLQELEQKRGQEIDMAQEMMEVTAKIAVKALFSQDLEGSMNMVYESMTDIQRYIVKRFRNPLFTLIAPLTKQHAAYKNNMAVMVEIIENIINERRKSGVRENDLLQMLMDARYEDTGKAMSNQQLRDEIITMFSAGHETSANALTWTLYLLTQNPHIFQTLKQEVQTILGDTSPTFESIRALTYTQQVLQEGMRFYPPAWIVGRTALTTDEFQGTTIKKGTNVLCVLYLLHRNPALWEQPEQFDPTRFTPENMKKRPRNHYLPFGAGPRMCIGNHFAMMEMQLLLATLVQHFDFKLADNQKITPEALVTLRPQYGVRMILS